MATPGVQVPSPAGALRVREDVFNAALKVRALDVITRRAIDTRLRCTCLAQADLRCRLLTALPGLSRAPVPCVVQRLHTAAASGWCSSPRGVLCTLAAHVLHQGPTTIGTLPGGDRIARVHQRNQGAQRIDQGQQRR